MEVQMSVIKKMIARIRGEQKALRSGYNTQYGC